MADRGIIFTGESVRAILDGRKTMTRRVVKLGEFDISDTPGYDYHFRDRRMRWNDVTTARLLERWAPYRAGQRLYVKETWGLCVHFDYTDWCKHSLKGFTECPPDWQTEYRAEWQQEHEDCVWRSPRYMPKWAARIWLEVTGVEVEPLQVISELDAMAEGILPIGDVGCPCEGEDDDPGPHIPGCSWSHLDVDPDEYPHRAAFAVEWDRINGKRAPWSSNPWVWVISFRRIDP